MILIKKRVHHSYIAGISTVWSHIALMSDRLTIVCTLKIHAEFNINFIVMDKFHNNEKNRLLPLAT